jgi:uncharacterized protein YjbI with pentapeptide repeats
VTRRELIDRWRSTAPEILGQLANGGSLRDVDLRGLPAGGLESRGASLDGADLGEATLAHAHLYDLSFTRCRFDGADLTEALFQGGSVTGATMAGAVLRHTLVAGARWEAVDFTGAKLTNFSPARTVFVHCTFPALAKVEFDGCTFEDCRFTGGLKDVQFLGRRHPSVLRRVTFESDALRYAEFDGMEFEDVTFPPGDAVIVVPRAFRAVAERAGRLSSSRTDDVGREFRHFLSEESLRTGLSETAGWAVARRDLVADYDEEFAAFAASVFSSALR